MCKKINKTALFAAMAFCVLGTLFSSCATPQAAYASVSSDGQFYKTIENHINSPSTIYLQDTSLENNINGTYPDHIYIKTPTQTFTKDYEFMIRAGKLYYKAKTEALWNLYAKTGLPDGAACVTEISGDSNCVFVFDDLGRLYRTYTEKEVRNNAASPFYVKPFTWIYLYGWPQSVVFKQGLTVKDKRAWAMGARRKDLLWHEDIFGNEHHYGTMGLETIYFLTKNGQEIRFTDSGLPADLSKTFLTPQNGRFIAVNLSNSGSTNFIIGDKGSMYTRLIDFDTMGCDPMFFKYTYEPYKSKYKGSEYRSNFESWALPAEDWKKQADIKLEGKARLTKFISIHQNGQGNSARELRVAGLDKDGNTGFYYKLIFDSEWTFKKCPLALKEEDFLSGKEEWGSSAECSFKGGLFENSKAVEGVKVEVLDFTLANEGSFNLNITMQKDGWSESKTIHFYDVEMWTYMVRVDPGKDGMPKNFFVTPDFTKEDLNCAHEEFSALLKKLFDGLSRKTFCIKSSASINYLELSWTNEKTLLGGNNFLIFMDKEGIAGDPVALKAAYMYEEPALKAFNSQKLVFEKEVYTAEDAQQLKEAAQINKDYAKFLNGQMQVYNGYKHNTNKSRWQWNIADLALSVTFLNKIDFPKIKTVTMHSGELFNQNADSYGISYEYMSIVYPHVISLAKLRAQKYEEIAEELEKNKTASNLEFYKKDCSEYLNALGLKGEYEGIAVQSNKKAKLYQIKEVPLYPGFLLVQENENKDSVEYAILELADFEEKALDFLIKEKTKFSCNVNFYVTAKNENFLNRSFGVAELEKRHGKLIFDGNNIKIKAGTKLLFKSGN